MAVYSNTGDVLQYAQNQQRMSQDSFANTMAMIMKLLQIKQDQGQFDTGMSAKGDAMAQDQAWEREKWAGEAPVRKAQTDRDNAYTANMNRPEQPKKSAIEAFDDAVDAAVANNQIPFERGEELKLKKRTGYAPPAPPKVTPPKITPTKVPTKSALQSKLELIDADTNLTPEEKIAARKAALGVKAASAIGSSDPNSIENLLNPPGRKQSWADMKGMMGGGIKEDPYLAQYRLMYPGKSDQELLAAIQKARQAGKLQ